ncbi:MAG: ribosome maturation factor RimP [Legionellales bacterium]|nr:ribosome maturation factor RimP [Legionellales bacterium]
MKRDTLEDLLCPEVIKLGYQWWGLEFFVQGKHSLLRIYIDKPEGIQLDDCQVVSEHISAVLDVAEPISHHYTLEVSSPGIERPLFTREQMMEYIGRQVKVSMKIRINGQRRFTGVLQCVQETQLVLLTEQQQSITLPIADIEKTHLVAE